MKCEKCGSEQVTVGTKTVDNSSPESDNYDYGHSEGPEEVKFCTCRICGHGWHPGGCLILLLIAIYALFGGAVAAMASWQR